MVDVMSRRGLWQVTNHGVCLLADEVPTLSCAPTKCVFSFLSVTGEELEKNTSSEEKTILQNYCTAVEKQRIEQPSKS